MQHSPIIAQFRSQFSLVLANTPELIEEVYRIRYQVYCQELHYEPEANCQNQMEMDEYDNRSIHCLLMHRPSGLYAGCFRLILSRPPEVKFPFEKVYNNKLCYYTAPFSKIPHNFIGEVSRLAVTARFRKSQNQATMLHAIGDECESQQENVRGCSLIPLSLYLAMTSISLEIGLNSALAMMEPRLARHLRRFGINFTQIADVVDYHGKRALFKITPEEVVNGLNSRSYYLFQLIHSDIQAALTYGVPEVLRYRAASLKLTPLPVTPPLQARA